MALTLICVYSPTERTEKIPMGSIKHVVTEPIEGHEDYHMMVTRFLTTNCTSQIGS